MSGTARSNHRRPSLSRRRPRPRDLEAHDAAPGPHRPASCSAKPRAWSARLRIPKAMVAASNEPALAGSSRASPSRNSSQGASAPASRARSSIPREMSIPTTRPKRPTWSARLPASLPVPVATSIAAIPRFQPGEQATMLRRQRGSWKPDMTAYTGSSAARPVDIAPTARLASASVVGGRPESGIAAGRLRKARRGRREARDRSWLRGSGASADNPAA